MLLFIFAGAMLFAQEKGMASYYAGKFQGRKTANGETFDTNQLTAAHKTLPFNTIVRVTSDENGRVVYVRINDRGPFVPGRIIDLSKAAAEAIDMLGAGVTPVSVEILRMGDGQTYHTKRPPSGKVHIQVAAFEIRANAEKAVELLESYGLRAELERRRQGVSRVLVRNVPMQDVALTKTLLENVGFPNVFVRQ